MASPFLGVYTAIYDYTPQNPTEIAFDEGDLLCVLEKPTDDDWWKAKKKGNSVDDEEPVGLVPSNYIEEAKPIRKYKALYDYSQQTEEELSFREEDVLNVYDNTDPDWTLVGLNGQYGYAPTSYIEKIEEGPGATAAAAIAAATKKHVAFTEAQQSPALESPASGHHPPPQELRPVSPPLPDRSSSQASQPSSQAVPSPRSSVASPSSAHFRPGSTYNREDNRDHAKPAANRDSKSPKLPRFVDSDDSDGPGLPLRRPGEPPYRSGREHTGGPSPSIPPGFRTYPVMEVDSRKKRAATLGLGPNRIILLPDKSTRPREDWTIDNMTGYNHEGKHVFLDLKHPSKSLDLHAGSTHAAEEIISTLGELRGIRKAAGLDEVIAAANGAKKNDIGTVLYDFPAQGEDEVSVTAGDEVIILDDSNDEWWLVRRQVNGAEGVLPSNYVERGRKSIPPVSGIRESPGIRSDARRSQHAPSSTTGSEVGVSKVPERRSSLAQPPQGRKTAPAKLSMPQLSRLRYRKERPLSEILLTDVIAEPDTSQIRTWTDRTGCFKVEAQFLGCKDGKIQLHKVNGVKIAVPVSKVSMIDLKYVEDRTKISLDEDKPLSEILKEQRKNNPQAGVVIDRTGNRANVGAAVVSPAFPSPKKNDFDWFDFFLGCGVDFNNCQRYAHSFQKDEMDESSLEGIKTEVMRTLGMKEGDILRVMKKLDEKYSRLKKQPSRDGMDGNSGKSLFTDGNGNLKSSRGRPPPAVQTGAVDPKALQTQKESLEPKAPSPISGSPPPPSTTQPVASGFDDEAWVPKPTKPQSPAPQSSIRSTPQQVATQTPQPPQLTGALSDIATLSLDTPPLQPTVKSPPPFVPPPSQPPQLPQLSQPAISTQVTSYQPQPQGMSGGNFSAVTQIPSILTPTHTGINGHLGSYQTGRARPAAPTIAGGLGIAPPPTRSFSAPQTFAPAPMQTMTPPFAGNPNAMIYTSMAPLGPQPAPPTMMGVSGGTASQIPYQPTGFGTVGQFPNGGFSQQPGYQIPQIQQHMTGLQQQSPPFQTFSNAPSIGSFSVNRTLPLSLIQPTAAPLQPQPTGPAPAVRFGVSQKKLTPQPTGRANLNKATPDNPFGF